MIVKHLMSWLVLFTLFSATSVTLGGQCDDWIFLCEHQKIFVDSEAQQKTIRMPLTSSNCTLSGDVGVCKSTLSAKKGQLMIATAGIFFELGKTPASPCAVNRQVQFTSATDFVSKTDRKCGTYMSSSTLFESVTNEMTIEYRSDYVEDGATIDVSAFGCSTEAEDTQILHGTLESTAVFSSYDSQYNGLVTCDEGYLMSGHVRKKSTTCKRLNTAGSVATGSWSWQIPAENYTCKRVKCAEVMLPANSQVTLSNELYYESAATFSCSEGYRLEGGSSTYKCSIKDGVGGFWDGTLPNCKIVECGMPNITNAAYTIPAVRTYQTTFQYSCGPGTRPFNGTAVCNSEGQWELTECEVLFCPELVIGDGWMPLSTLPSLRTVGTSLSIICQYDNTIIATECKFNERNNSEPAWTAIRACTQPPPPPPIERIKEESLTSNRPALIDRAGIIGGIVAGIVFAVVVIILACLFVRKSSEKKKAAQNNNEKIQLDKLKEPLTGTIKSNGSRKLNSEEVKLNPNDGVVEEGPQVAAVVKHYRNRGNRLRNGLNSGHSTLGTVGSHKSFSESGNSVERLETGDLYDSIMNGKATHIVGRQSSSSGTSVNSVVARVENEFDEPRLNGSYGQTKKPLQINDASTFM